MTKPTADKERQRRSWADLGPRVLSALVLVPVTFLALYLGGIWFACLVGLVFAGAYREWEIMSTSRKPDPVGYALIGVVTATAIAYVLQGYAAAGAVSAVGILIALLAPSPSRIWRAFGVFYFSLVIVAVLALRGSTDLGITAGLFLGITVWLTDTAAFFSGRQIGGPKLSPEISPSKTWSGAIGGLVIGASGASLFWVFFVPSPWWIGLVLALTVSFLGQLGDLTESAIKRHFRIKDSSNLIPGHGGLMDRLDSLTFAVLVVFVVSAMHENVDAIASGFLLW